MKKVELSKTHRDLQFLALLTGILAFLVLGYLAGNIVWLNDFQYFIGLISGIFSLFIGVLALVRFYTKKTDINFLFLGTGFLSVGVVEIYQLVGTLGGFEDLFSYTPTEIYPIISVIAKLFLSIVMFSSWFVGREKKSKNKKFEKMIMLFDLGIFIFFTIMVGFLLFTDPMAESLLATILGMVSLMFFSLALLGYLFKKEWKYDNFDYWIIFSLCFAILSQLYYLPFLNLEYENMVNISVWASFFSYLALLIGFLNSIYELYQREVEIQKELEKKNKEVKETKAKVEEAYMMLRKEKWDITKKKGVADKILKDIVK